MEEPRIGDRVEWSGRSNAGHIMALEGEIINVDDGTEEVTVRWDPNPCGLNLSARVPFEKFLTDEWELAPRMDEEHETLPEQENPYPARSMSHADALHLL